jgi:hypothetical protein
VEVQLNCPDCGDKTKSIRKRIKKDVSIGSLSSMSEFLAVILFLSVFFYEPVEKHTVLVILAAIILALNGHGLRYKRISVEYCKRCQKEYPINES